MSLRLPPARMIILHSSRSQSRTAKLAGQLLVDDSDFQLYCVDCLDVGLVDSLTAISLEAKLGNLWHAVDGHAYHANGHVLQAQPKRRLPELDFIGLLCLGVCRPALSQLLDAVVELLRFGLYLGP